MSLMSSPHVTIGGEHAGLLGQSLLSRGLVFTDDLAAALDEQKHSHRPLGEILIRRGALDRNALHEALRRQTLLREGAYRIGDLLIWLGLVSDEDLRWALEEQASGRERIGRILVDAGRLAADDLARALVVQSDLRRRLIAGAVLISVAIQPFAALAADLSHAAAMTQTVEVVVHVPDVMNVSEGLKLALPGTPGIDRVRLLQPLLPYERTPETVTVTASPAGGGDAFLLTAAGHRPLPVSLRLMVDPVDEMIDLQANLAAHVPARTGPNSHALELAFDRPSLESLEGGPYTGMIRLVIAPD